MTALATPDAVVRRLEEEPNERMLVMIEEYLDEASDAARAYGREWTDLNVPAPISRLVASAVARFIRNPDQYNINRAGDETVGWHDRGEIDWFTEAEIARIGRFAVPKLASFGTIQVAAFGTTRPATYGDRIPVVGGASTKPFPFLGVNEIA